LSLRSTNQSLPADELPS